jgi:hypothetical protein
LDIKESLRKERIRKERIRMAFGPNRNHSENKYSKRLSAPTGKTQKGKTQKGNTQKGKNNKGITQQWSCFRGVIWQQVGVKLHAQARSSITSLPEVGLTAEVAKVAKRSLLSQTSSWASGG